MATLEISGFEALVGGLKDMIEDVPNLCNAMLNAEADVVEPAIAKSARSEMRARTGRLSESIVRTSKNKEIHIFPTGFHHSTRKKSVGNNDVGFVLEHGATRRNIRARAWMSKAVDATKSQAFDAAERVYAEYIQKHN